MIFQSPTLEDRQAWVTNIKDLNAKLMNTKLQNTLHGRRTSVATLLLKVLVLSFPLPPKHLLSFLTTIKNQSGSVFNLKQNLISGEVPATKEGRLQFLLNVVNQEGNNRCADCTAPSTVTPLHPLSPPFFPRAPQHPKKTTQKNTSLLYSCKM